MVKNALKNFESIFVTILRSYIMVTNLSSRPPYVEDHQMRHCKILFLLPFLLELSLVEGHSEAVAANIHRIVRDIRKANPISSPFRLITA